ncbi:hypothetical protein SAMD00019534_067060, partial [Acytostelium subglobosum LB1]|uniref:hypothetical protein n=1 Tax=Acytostelium subglobosum LB1 TaxID=1410327 RepID=UPI000644A921
HYSIIIDIRAESNDYHVTGVELHLVKSNEDICYLCAGYRTRSRETFRVTLLGRAKSELPMVDALQRQYLLESTDPNNLVSFGSKVFSNFIQNECNGKSQWSSQANCQRFARYLANELGLNWPQYISL